MTTPMTEAPAPTALVPEQPVDTVETRVPPVDHVRRHGLRCYWDLRECRWTCHPT